VIADEIRSERITLRILDDSHVGDRYLTWMNDLDVIQYLESRYSPASLEGLASFVTSMRESPDSYLFGIMSNETGEHLGNIKLGPINSHHLRGPVGVIIGERSAWGRGIATEAVAALSGWAFDSLGLRKLVAGSYTDNVGSTRAFEKAGFRIEGHQLQEIIKVDGTRGDVFVLGMTLEDRP